MSGTTEVPDIIGSITNAVGLDRLWRTDEQADSEKRKSQQEDKTTDSKDEEAPRTKQTAPDESGKDVAPVSIKQEREKEKQWERTERTDVDHDMDVNGVPRPITPPKPSAQKGKGYEWPMPSSLKNNQPKRKYDSEPTGDDKHPPPPEADEEQPPPEEQPSKASFMGALKPFLNQQHSSSPGPSGPQTAPVHEANPFDRPRPQSSSSQKKPDRRNLRRQYTTPAPASAPEADDNTDPEVTKQRHAVAKSRWVAAAQGLRFPLRRKKEDKRASKTRGTEVITSLVAGAPAANIIASHMVPDEHSHHRIPVIVDLLKAQPPCVGANSRSTLSTLSNWAEDIFCIGLI